VSGSCEIRESGGFREKLSTAENAEKNRRMRGEELSNAKGAKKSRKQEPQRRAAKRKEEARTRQLEPHSTPKNPKRNNHHGKKQSPQKETEITAS
jgi:hypothetical protein